MQISDERAKRLGVLLDAMSKILKQLSKDLPKIRKEPQTRNLICACDTEIIHLPDGTPILKEETDE